MKQYYIINHCDMFFYLLGSDKSSSSYHLVFQKTLNISRSGSTESIVRILIGIMMLNLEINLRRVDFMLFGFSNLIYS